MVFKVTITIEWNGWGQPLGSMVFRWFWGKTTIGNDGFRWLCTIGPTMEWLCTIVEVYCQVRNIDSDCLLLEKSTVTLARRLSTYWRPPSIFVLHMARWEGAIEAMLLLYRSNNPWTLNHQVFRLTSPAEKLIIRYKLASVGNGVGKRTCVALHLHRKMLPHGAFGFLLQLELGPAQLPRTLKHAHLSFKVLLLH